MVELRGGGRIHRLIQIVAGLVIDIADPIAASLLIRRARLITKLEGQRGYALADETLLIAADEAVLFRLLIGLHFHAQVGRGGADLIA